MGHLKSAIFPLLPRQLQLQAPGNPIMSECHRRGTCDKENDKDLFIYISDISDTPSHELSVVLYM